MLKRWQAITWTNDGLVRWCIYAPHCHELMILICMLFMMCPVASSLEKGVFKLIWSPEVPVHHHACYSNIRPQWITTVGDGFIIYVYIGLCESYGCYHMYSYLLLLCGCTCTWACAMYHYMDFCPQQLSGMLMNRCPCNWPLKLRVGIIDGKLDQYHMAADALAPWVTRLSAVTVLTVR